MARLRQRNCFDMEKNETRNLSIYYQKTGIRKNYKHTCYLNTYLIMNHTLTLSIKINFAFLIHTSYLIEIETKFIYIYAFC